jgi:hypothetical protein
MRLANPPYGEKVEARMSRSVLPSRLDPFPCAPRYGTLSTDNCPTYRSIAEKHLSVRRECAPLNQERLLRWFLALCERLSVLVCSRTLLFGPGESGTVFPSQAPDKERPFISLLKDGGFLARSL